MEEPIKQANPTLHKYLFTVTTFSKLLAMFLFISLPFIGFYLGMQYQQKLTVTPVVSEIKTTPAPTVNNMNVNLIPYLVAGGNRLDTSTWQAYSILNLYSISYPSAWKEAIPGDGGATDFVAPDNLITIITVPIANILDGSITSVADRVASTSKGAVYRSSIKVDGHDAIIQEITSSDTRISVYISGFKIHLHGGNVVQDENGYVGIDFVIDKSRETLAREYIQSILSTIKITNK